MVILTGMCQLRDICLQGALVHTTAIFSLHRLKFENGQQYKTNFQLRKLLTFSFDFCVLHKPATLVTKYSTRYSWLPFYIYRLFSYYASGKQIVFKIFCCYCTQYYELLLKQTLHKSAYFPLRSYFTNKCCKSPSCLFHISNQLQILYSDATSIKLTFPINSMSIPWGIY